MGLRELQKQFIERVEDASGKPVILQSDSAFHGHATIKVATNDQPAHLLLYKPEQESVLPYLVAYQCEFALRTIQANLSAQFNLAATVSMLPDVLELMQRHHLRAERDPSFCGTTTGQTIWRWTWFPVAIHADHVANRQADS